MIILSSSNISIFYEYCDISSDNILYQVSVFFDIEILYTNINIYVFMYVKDEYNDSL